MALWGKLRRIVQRAATSQAVFGEPIEWHPGGSGSVTTTPTGAQLVGIFVSPHVEVSTDREVSVSTVLPQLDVVDEHLPSGRPFEADEVTVYSEQLPSYPAGTRYKITERMEDGQGMSSLFLQELEVAP